MSGDSLRAADRLNLRFLADHPIDAARLIEQWPVERAVEVMVRQSVTTLLPVWQRLLPDTAAPLLMALPEKLADGLLSQLPASVVVRILGNCDPAHRDALLGRLEPAIRQDIETLLSYPKNTAGSIMDVAVAVYRRELTVGDALKQLKKKKDEDRTQSVSR